MASRLNLWPVWLGHWRGLSMRRYRYDLDEDDDRSVTITPDRLARGLTLSVPVVAGLIAGFAVDRRPADWHLDVGVAAVVVAAATLLSAGLLGAFALLASWRDRIEERARRRQRPLRALIDEAVAHILLATLEAALLMASAVVALVARGWVAEAATVVSAMFGAHILFLFVLLVPRLYSAYAQVVDVDIRLDGHTRV